MSTGERATARASNGAAASTTEDVARITINDSHFELTPDTDIPALKAAIEQAVKSDGAFIDFDVAGGRTVSALIGSPCDVFISVGPAEDGPLWSDDADYDV